MAGTENGSDDKRSPAPAEQAAPPTTLAELAATAINVFALMTWLKNHKRP